MTIIPKDKTPEAFVRKNKRSVINPWGAYCIHLDCGWRTYASNQGTAVYLATDHVRKRHTTGEMFNVTYSGKLGTRYLFWDTEVPMETWLELQRQHGAVIKRNEREATYTISPPIPTPTYDGIKDRLPTYTSDEDNSNSYWNIGDWGEYK